MKLKKSVKRFLIILLILIVLAGGAFLVWKFYPKERVQEVATVVSEIPGYGYTLKSNKSEQYKEMFQELTDILNQSPVDEEAYVEQISKMFILDFYTLSDKVANTDVGGVDFVHSTAQANFLEKAEDTFYKYVESDIYDNRDQELPLVDEVTVNNIETVSYTIGTDVTDENAYQVSLSWTYKKDLGYQTAAILTFVHEDNKLALVEMVQE